jgi:pyruvate dehydrogenase E2 component (dihydrolipoamide acetyltransferase)
MRVARRPGDSVRKGDVSSTVDTEKSEIEVEVWQDAVSRSSSSTSAPASAAPAPTPPTAHAPDDPTADATDVAPGGAPAQHLSATSAAGGTTGGRVPASPLARRLAAERGIDIGALRGSGPGGAVIEADVLAAASAASVTTPVATTQPPASPSPSPRRSPDTMRTLIAERMATSNREIPHYHLSRDLDVGPLESWLAERNADRPIAERILPAACFIRAVALAASRHRELNGFWIDDHLEPADAINVATAISLRRGGLVTPHIERADERSLIEVMTALTELVTAARTGRLRASWMTGATITVTHLGDTGADLVHGVISPPQVALVGFGRSRPQPWVIDDAVVVRPVVTSTLAADHRATDGAIGSRFLATLADLIHRPEDLL